MEIHNLRFSVQLWRVSSPLNMISIIEFQRLYFWSDISLTPHWLEALANPEDVGQAVYIFMTSADTVCNRRFTAWDAVECLGQVDAPSLNKVNVNVSNSGFSGTCVFVPIVDGTLITKQATELLCAGRVNGISIPKIHVLDLV